MTAGILCLMFAGVTDWMVLLAAARLLPRPARMSRKGGARHAAARARRLARWAVDLSQSRRRQVMPGPQC